jgi:axial budding pattern protein 2
VGGVSLNLVATDNTGSTTLTATLVVSASPGPRVEIPLQSQPPDFGTFSSPSTILSTPGKNFSFKLKPNTFSNPPGAVISYYAIMTDNTPLPAWVSFDSPSLSFTGRTPPAESLVQPPQHFSFRVIATDVVGFAGAAMDFDIVVGSHQLAANEPTIILNATRGALLSYTGLRDTVKVDGEPAVPGSVVVAATPDIPRWLSFDKQTWRLTGVPPDNAESANFTITLRDTFSNNLNVTVLIGVTGDRFDLFTTRLPKLTVTPGEPFSFDLRSYLLNPQDTEVSLEADTPYPWVRFDPDSTTLFGDAPEGLGDSTVGVKVMAKSKKSKKSASLSFELVIRAVSDGKGSTSSDSTSTGGSFNSVLLAVLLPLLFLLALAVCILFWYFRRRKEPRKPALSTRDISGPLPGTFVTKSDGLHVSHSLPDLSKGFGKSFSADDVFGSEKKSYFNSRTVFLTNPELFQPVGEVKSLPPNNKPAPESGNQQGGVSLPSIVSEAVSPLRSGTRSKISNSLSSITETSIGDLVDSRGIELVGSDSRRTFRDKIEINVPKFLQTPGSLYPGSTSPTETASTPRPGSARTAPEMDSVPLRSDSRASSYYHFAPAARKLSWPWLKGVKGKRHGTKLVPGMQRLSEQPSLLTVDTFTSEATEQPSPTIPVTQENDPDGVAVLGPETLPLPQFPRRASLSRPPTRSGPTGGETRGKLGSEPLHTSDTTTTLPTPIPSLFGVEDDPMMPGFPIRGGPPTGSLDVYGAAAMEHNPFRPSRTWSTVPTADEWADETVESLTLSRSTSQPQQNWMVFQESSPIAGRDTAAPVKSAEMASSVRLPQAQEGEGGEGEGEDRQEGAELSVGFSSPEVGPTVKLREEQKRERSGLTRKSQSNGVSLRSGGSRSDYAVFI